MEGEGEKTSINDITKDIEVIKQKLLEINLDYQPTIRELNEKNKNFSNGDNLILKVINDKKKIVTLNLGGLKASTYLYKLAMLEDSIFYKLILEDINSNKEVRDEFYFDVSNTHFDIIITYIRTGILITDMLTSIEITDLCEVLEVLGLWDVLKTTRDSLCFKIINVTYSGINASIKSTADYNNLHKRDNKCGYATSAVNSWITFELEKEHIITKIQISALVNGKPSTFTESAGKLSEISVSSNNSTFNVVGKIPDNYGINPITIKIKPVKAKFIKFQNTNSFIGIGYLKIS